MAYLNGAMYHITSSGKHDPWDYGNRQIYLKKKEKILLY